MAQRGGSDRSTLSIGAVAKRSGVAASALRYYEREGLLPRADRDSGGRVWREDVLDRLALIGVAKEAGFTIREIRSLLAGISRRSSPGPRWRRLAARKRGEIDARIEDLARMRRVLDSVSRCACPTLEDCSRALRADRLP